MLPVRGSGCVLFVPGPRQVEVVAVALLLGFLLCSGSLLVLPEEGFVCAHSAVLLRQGLQSSDCGRLLNSVGKPSVD